MIVVGAAASASTTATMIGAARILTPGAVSSCHAKATSGVIAMNKR